MHVLDCIFQSTLIIDIDLVVVTGRTSNQTPTHSQSWLPRDAPDAPPAKPARVPARPAAPSAAHAKARRPPRRPPDAAAVARRLPPLMASNLPIPHKEL